MAVEFRRWMPEQWRMAPILRWMLYIGLIILVFWLIGAVILLVFASVLLATLLSVASRRVNHYLSIGYGWSLALVVVAIILAVAGIGFAIAPAVSAQLSQVARGLPQALNSIVGGIAKTSIGHMLVHRMAAGGSGGNSFAGPLISTVGSLFETIGYIIFVIFMGIYLAATPDLYERGVVRLLPPERRARGKEILEALGHTLKYFLFGRLFSMCVIAACSIVGLWILGIPAAIALGLISGVLSFVPYAGSIASGVAPFLLAYLQDPIKGVYVIILYIGIHLLDGYVLVPLVQQRMVDLLPALTLTAQIVLAFLWGILGIAVATPLTAVLMVLIEMAYVEDVLEARPSSTTPG